jgi:hypothetical protein
MTSFAVSLAALSASAPATAAEISAEGQTPGTKIIVREVKRDAAGTVTLRFQLVNDGAQTIKTYGVLGEYFTLSHVTLIDTAGKKKYLVVEDAEKHCVCSELKDDVKQGTRFNLWAKFPAPPADVAKITVVVPGFEPVDVPITAATP